MGSIQKVAFIVRQARKSAFELYAEKSAVLFRKSGTQVLILNAVSGMLPQESLQELKKFSPEFTFSFAAMELKEEAALPAFTGVPHLVWFKDPGFFAVPFLSVKNLHFALLDRSDALWFKQCGNESSLFLPFPALEEWKTSPFITRELPVVVFESERTAAEVKEEWERELGRIELMVLEGALNGYFDNPRSTLLDEMTASLRFSDVIVKADRTIAIFDYLSTYLAYWEKERLIEEAQKVTEVVIAPRLPLENMLEWMRRSQVVLVGTFGTSISMECEAAILSGAYPIYCRTPYLESLFPNLGVDRNEFFRVRTVLEEQKNISELQDRLLENLSLQEFVRSITSYMSDRLHS